MEIACSRAFLPKSNFFSHRMFFYPPAHTPPHKQRLAYPVRRRCFLFLPCFTRPQVSMPPLRVFPHPRDLHRVGGGHDLHGAPCRPRPAEAPPGMSTPSFALPWPRPTPRTPPPTKSTTSSSLATVRRLTLLQPAAEASFPSRPSCLRTMEIVSKEKRHVLLREIWRRWASTLLDMGVRIVARFHSTPAAPRTAAGVGDGRKGESAMAV